MRAGCWFATYWRNSCVVSHYEPSSFYWTWYFRNQTPCGTAAPASPALGQCGTCSAEEARTNRNTFAAHHQYEAYAGFHVVHLHTDGAPLLLFSAPSDVPMSYYCEYLLPLAAHGDGHVLTVSIALLLAILTGRSDLCIAGVFGAGKTRSLAVLLIALSCELKEFVAIIYTKENVASPGGGCGPPRGMATRGGGGPVRVRGDVKLFYSAGELLKAPVPNEP